MTQEFPHVSTLKQPTLVHVANTSKALSWSLHFSNLPIFMVSDVSFEK